LAVRLVKLCLFCIIARVLGENCIGIGLAEHGLEGHGTTGRMAVPQRVFTLANKHVRTIKSESLGKEGWIGGLVIGWVEGVEVSDEEESLKLEYGFVKAVLYSAFIHQEPVENPCV